MLGLIANLFGYLLKFWYSVVGNYGWALLLFSITIKALLFPLTLKQQKSTKKTQELQPKLQALQEKYKDDQEKMQIEYQKFMKENNFNPFGGCLLMILQLFVLIGVLYVVTNPLKYMEKLSQEEITDKLRLAIISEDFSGDINKYNEYVNDYIQTYSGDEGVQKSIKEFGIDNKEIVYLDSYKKYNRYYELKVLKNTYDLNFLGINLGNITLSDPKDLKLWIFPVLTTIFYYLSLWMVSKNQKKNTQKMKDAEGNEVEMPNMAMMNITMPLLSGWISASVPQGMGLYWFSNSFLQVIIQFVTEKVLDKNKTEQKPENVVIEAKDTQIDGEPIKEEVKEKKNNNSGKNKKKHKK